MKVSKAVIEAQDRKIMRYIEVFLMTHSYPPSLREIKKGLDITSLSTVFDALKRLERDGYITRSKHIARGIKLTKKQMFT